MYFTDVRNFGKVAEHIEIPSLSKIQCESYDRFLQVDVSPGDREAVGLEGLLREIFPIVSYDENMKLEYLDYELGKLPSVAYEVVVQRRYTVSWHYLFKKYMSFLTRYLITDETKTFCYSPNMSVHRKYWSLK